MEKKIRNKEFFIEQARQHRLSFSLQDNLDSIDRFFRYPIGITPEMMNEAIILQDAGKLAEYKVCLEKCRAKKNRIKALLEAAPDAEARDDIMCKVTKDPDAEF